MEAAGLAIGIAGLAGLFSAGLNIIDKVDSYRDFPFESQVLFAQFDADKLRFRQWGPRVGIVASTQQEHHHKALDDPAVNSVVVQILKSIKEIDGDTENLSENDQLQSRPGGSKPSRHVRLEKFRGATSRKNRFSWAARDKLRFLSLIESFAGLVQRLYDLVPPDGSEAMGQPIMQRNPTLFVSGMCAFGCFCFVCVFFQIETYYLTDNAKPSFDFQRIAIKLEKQLESRCLYHC